MPLINQVSLIHLIFLCLWGGVVATESVLELYPYRKKEMRENAIRYHFWIDLLVEMPLILAVIATGLTLAVLAWPISALHWVKIGCASAAVSANLVCVALVVQRGQRLNQGVGEMELWKLTRRIVTCAVAGLPFATVAAGAGFWLAYHRLLDLIK